MHAPLTHITSPSLCITLSSLAHLRRGLAASLRRKLSAELDNFMSGSPSPQPPNTSTAHDPTSPSLNMPWLPLHISEVVSGRDVPETQQGMPRGDNATPTPPVASQEPSPERIPWAEVYAPSVLTQAPIAVVCSWPNQGAPAVVRPTARPVHWQRGAASVTAALGAVVAHWEALHRPQLPFAGTADVGAMLAMGAVCASDGAGAREGRESGPAVAGAAGLLSSANAGQWLGMKAMACVWAALALGTRAARKEPPSAVAGAAAGAGAGGEIDNKHTTQCVKRKPRKETHTQ